MQIHKHSQQVSCPVLSLQIYNLGTGTGYSVLQMVEAMEKASGREVRHLLLRFGLALKAVSMLTAWGSSSPAGCGAGGATGCRLAAYATALCTLIGWHPASLYAGGLPRQVFPPPPTHTHPL